MYPPFFISLMELRQMKKLPIIIIASLLLVSQANATDMGIVTGSTKGTYYKIGHNIASLVSRYGINLKVMPSNGSLDNVVHVYETRSVQLGIAQSDVLSFIKNKYNGELKGIAKKIKMVFPLYNEEIHLLATHRINSLSDLDGKRVAVGKTDSGTYLTSKLIFEIAEIEPKMVKVGGSDALNQLANGQVDAMFYVAGYPVKLFQEFQKEKFHLVPITGKGVMEYYEPSVIPANTYPWQELRQTCGETNTPQVKFPLILQRPARYGSPRRSDFGA
jgi:TRAP transporter TAXI family solute receptor